MCRVFGFVQVDGEEHVVFLKVERRRLAGSEEVGDVFHLYEGHLGVLEFDAGRRYSKVDESVAFPVRP